MRITAFHAFVAYAVCTVSICAMKTDLTQVKDSSKVLKSSHNPLCPRGPIPITKLLPHEEDCSLFYICQNGRAILQKCPSNLYFNPSKSVCDFPGNTKCKKDDPPYPRGRINDLEMLVSCPSTPAHLLLPHPTDCGKFFSCDAGIARPSACQKGLHFNRKQQTCDYPENAGCDTGFTKNPRGKIGEGISNDLCPAEKTKFPVLKPHSSDCGKFYLCDGGTPHLKVCQPGLHFNPKAQTCDYPRNAGCESSTITEKPRDINSEDDAQCPIVHGGNPILLPHKTDCGKFYICDTGVPHLKVCHVGLHFNPKVQACDYPANAGCGPELSKKDPSGRLGEISSCSTSQNGIMLPHPSDCSKFFLCNEGESHGQKCPSGLHFNAALQVCDYPANVQCEKETDVLHSSGIDSPFCPTIEGKTPVFYRHPNNCSVYYMCSNGMAYRFECPARLHFNLRLRICDYEWIARCPTGNQVTTEVM